MPRITRKSSKARAVSATETEAVDIAVQENSTAEAAPTPTVQNQWILIAPKSSLEPNYEESAGTVNLVKLRNPRTAQEAVYGFTENNSKVVELQKFFHGKKSWFVGNTVQSDGSLYVASPVDPLFLALPYLTKSDYASPLDQLLVDSEFPETSRLSQSLEARNLEKIAEKKQTPSITAWKYDEGKALNWLSAKHKKLTHVLESSRLNASTVARSAAYVSAEKIDIDDYRRYAFGMLCEYLSPTIAKKLEQHLKLPEKTHEAPVHEPAAKRAKLSTESNEPLEDYSKYFNGATNENKEKAGNAKTKALANAAKGSKSITSFFKKK